MHATHFAPIQRLRGCGAQRDKCTIYSTVHCPRDLLWCVVVLELLWVVGRRLMRFSLAITIPLLHSTNTALCDTHRIAEARFV